MKAITLPPFGELRRRVQKSLARTAQTRTEVLGDCVNLSARLMANAPPLSVLADEETSRHTTGGGAAGREWTGRLDWQFGGSGIIDVSPN